MKQTVKIIGKYNYGKCHCCGKKFTRSIRGLLVGLGTDGELYKPVYPHLDPEPKVTFDVPVKIERVIKLGMTCYQKAEFINK